MVGPLGICCSEAERRRFVPSNRFEPKNLMIPPRRVIWRRLPSWKQAILAPPLPLRLIWESNLRTNSQASTSSNS